MEIKLVFLVLVLSIMSCKSNTNSVLGVSRNINTEPLNEFIGDNQLEKKAVSRIKKYFDSIGLRTDEFFVGFILYPNSTKDNTSIVGSFSVALDLSHLKSINYLDSLSEVNKELSEKHKGEEWIPIIPPPTGNISGIDRTIYYYSKGDSVVDFLSQ